MTGIYEIKINNRPVESIGMNGDCEMPQEIWKALNEWWYNAKSGDIFSIRCECPD